MRVWMTLMLLTVLALVTFADQRGITMRTRDERLQIGDAAEILDEGTLQPDNIVTYKRSEVFTTTLDSVFVKVVLRPGEWQAIYVDADAGTLGYTAPVWDDIDSLLSPWILSAPQFLQDQLRVNLAGISHYMAEYYDLMLSEADPLWLDELYYCLANLAPEILEMAEMYYLLPLNVQYCYMADTFLNYVELVDYGTPGGPDHYTTAHYYTTDTNLVTFSTVEIDPEIYYLHVMFPKISDEQPAYIYPVTGDIVDPWSGEFWRSYFWDIADTTGDFECWALGDSLMATDCLWKGRQNNITDNGAIGIMSQWIANCLIFDSDAERPVQPVRIYAKHKGRCGEHSDMRVAASRVGLIPCVCIEAISSDHVWNEFYNGYRWSHCEFGNIDNSFMYQDGWGKEFGTVYRHDGKSWHTPVTERYSHALSTINMLIRDALFRPIDGANAVIAMENWIYGDTALYYDVMMHTNSRGECYTVVGNAHQMFWRAESDIGTNPAPGYVDNLVTLPLGGTNYSRHKTIAATLPDYTWTEEIPTTTPDAWLGARIQPVGEFIKYDAPFMSIDAKFLRWVEDDAYGFTMAAITDSQFALFEAGSTLKVLAIADQCDYGAIETPIGDTPHWLVISNKGNIRNTLVGNLAVMIHDSSTGIVVVDRPDEISLSLYPNPFNGAVTISLNVIPGLTRNPEIEIFDINGRIVAEIPANGSESAKPSSTNTSGAYRWQPAPALPSGVYLIRARFGGCETSRRVVYLK